MPIDWHTSSLYLLVGQSRVSYILISSIWSKFSNVCLPSWEITNLHGRSLIVLCVDYAGWADKIEGKSFVEDNDFYKIVRYEPIGVCAGIASWNATFMYVGWKMAPALAAGNCVGRPDQLSTLKSD